MKKLFSLSIGIILLWSFSGCDKTLDEAYTLDRVYFPNSFITDDGIVFYSSTKQSRVVKVKDNYARVMGYFEHYQTQDTMVEYGHCWSKDNQLPTIEDNLIETNESFDEYASDKGIDSFETRMNFLESETKYYVRSYMVDQYARIAYSPMVLEVETLRPENTWREANTGNRQFYLPGSSRKYAIMVMGQEYTIETGYVDKIYFGTGYNGLDYLNDFWSLDLETGYWSSEASFMNGYSGSKRSGAAAFAIKTRIYVGTGQDKYGATRQDLYAYNTVDARWSKKADFLGSNRRYAVGFSLEGKGYIGLGENLSEGGVFEKSDFFEFDPGSDPDFSGTWGGSGRIPSWNSSLARSRSVVFVINGRAFVGLGSVDSKTFFTDFRQFTPSGSAISAGSWYDIPSFPAEGREFAAAFTIDERGFVGTGTQMDENGTVLKSFKDFWRYDPFNRRWLQMADYTGGERYGAVAVGMEDKGYLGSGYKTETSEYTFDIFEYLP